MSVTSLSNRFPLAVFVTVISLVVSPTTTKASVLVMQRWNASPRQSHIVTRSSLSVFLKPSVWKTYRNVSAGYSIDYPAAWILIEHAAAAGILRTDFHPRNGISGVTVIVRSGSTVGGERSNVRCRRITVNSQHGISCFGTTTYTEFAAFSSRGRTYTIATSLKNAKQSQTKIYNQMVKRFRLIGSPIIRRVP